MNPTWRDTSLMETLVNVLGPFHKLTDAISAEKSVTISSLHPLLQHVKQLCQVAADGDTEQSEESSTSENISKALKTDIWEYINTRFVCRFLSSKLKNIPNNLLAVYSLSCAIMHTAYGQL